MPRNNGGKRKKASRPVGKVLHIFFEDKKSSRYYVEGLIKDKGYKSNISLEPHEHTDPINLVDDAKKTKKDYRTPPDDEFWVVYDAESLHQRGVSREHAPAYQNAVDSGINVAFSNVSYETWVLLHYEYSTRAFKESDDVERHIKCNHQADYDKADENIFLKLKDKLSEALKNANRLDAHNNAVDYGRKPYEINPYTDFHKLLKAIEEFNK